MQISALRFRKKGLQEFKIWRFSNGLGAFRNFACLFTGAESATAQTADSVDTVSEAVLFALTGLKGSPHSEIAEASIQLSDQAGDLWIIHRTHGGQAVSTAKSSQTSTAAPSQELRILKNGKPASLREDWTEALFGLQSEAIHDLMARPDFLLQHVARRFRLMRGPTFKLMTIAETVAQSGQRGKLEFDQSAFILGEILKRKHILHAQLAAVLQKPTEEIARRDVAEFLPVAARIRDLLGRWQELKEQLVEEGETGSADAGVETSGEKSDDKNAEKSATEKNLTDEIDVIRRIHDLAKPLLDPAKSLPMITEQMQQVEAEIAQTCADCGLSVEDDGETADASEGMNPARTEHMHAEQVQQALEALTKLDVARQICSVWENVLHVSREQARPLGDGFIAELDSAIESAIVLTSELQSAATATEATIETTTGVSLTSGLALTPRQEPSPEAPSFVQELSSLWSEGERGQLVAVAARRALQGFLAFGRWLRNLIANDEASHDYYDTSRISIEDTLTLRGPIPNVMAALSAAAKAEEMAALAPDPSTDELPISIPTSMQNLLLTSRVELQQSLERFRMMRTRQQSVSDGVHAFSATLQTRFEETVEEVGTAERQWLAAAQLIGVPSHYAFTEMLAYVRAHARLTLLRGRRQELRRSLNDLKDRLRQLETMVKSWRRTVGSGRVGDLANSQILMAEVRQIVRYLGEKETHLARLRDEKLTVDTKTKTKQRLSRRREKLGEQWRQLFVKAGLTLLKPHDPKLNDFLRLADQLQGCADLEADLELKLVLPLYRIGEHLGDAGSSGKENREPGVMIYAVSREATEADNNTVVANDSKLPNMLAAAMTTSMTSAMVLVVTDDPAVFEAMTTKGSGRSQTVTPSAQPSAATAALKAEQAKDDGARSAPRVAPREQTATLNLSGNVSGQAAAQRATKVLQSTGSGKEKSVARPAKPTPAAVGSRSILSEEARRTLSVLTNTRKT